MASAIESPLMVQQIRFKYGIRKKSYRRSFSNRGYFGLGSKAKAVGAAAPRSAVAAAENVFRTAGTLWKESWPMSYEILGLGAGKGLANNRGKVCSKSNRVGAGENAISIIARIKWDWFICKKGATDLG
jgi:hypothetical protein